MKIDVFSHVMPTGYKRALERKLPPAMSGPYLAQMAVHETLTDLDKRFRIMEKYGDLVQLANLTIPIVERLTEPGLVSDLTRMANDEMAEMVVKHPDRMVGAIGYVPLNFMDIALLELDRIVKDLHFRGIQVGASVNGKPLDSPEFMPIYEKMEKYDLPILIHPGRRKTIPDYPTETLSKYEIYAIFGWPWETSAAMTRLVVSHILDRFPRLKFVTHHCGGMVPYFDERISEFYSYREMTEKADKELPRPILDYYKSFYADTALNGSTAGLMCGYSFFGPGHLLFGTDMPFDGENGAIILRKTIESVERMAISSSEKKMIYESNARKLFHLKD
jgi:predicted TIM-barrel fold metal-dependent hydrolase